MNGITTESRGGQAAGRARAGLVVAGLASLALAGCAGGPGGGNVPLVEAAPTCGTRTFDIYFADSEAGLASSARQAIALTARALEAFTITSVKVTGLSDSRGGSAANLDLSERRARVVAEALAANGWPVPVFDVEAAGDAGATVAAGVAEPLRRRTEVVVEAVPK